MAKDRPQEKFVLIINEKDDISKIFGELIY